MLEADTTISSMSMELMIATRITNERAVIKAAAPRAEKMLLCVEIQIIFHYNYIAGV